MCGRYTRDALPGDIEEAFWVIQGPTVWPGPSWNVAPMQDAPIVGLAEGRRVARVHRWGLLPSWADPSASARAINARAETVARLPTFRAAFARRRCLIPATGFYEWQRVGKGKVPYLLHPTDQALFAFAGLWEARRQSDGSALRTYAVITTEPNAVAARVHDRMPVILPRDAWDAWLDPATPAEELQALLVPYPAERTEAYAVDPRVGSPANNDPHLVEPVRPGRAA